MGSKSDLLDSLKETYEYLSREDLEKSVDVVLEHIKGELGKGNRVEVRGFGSFSVRKRRLAGKKETYNTVYYRMSKYVQNILNS